MTVKELKEKWLRIKGELDIAIQIVDQAEEDGEEIHKQATLESLHDNRDANITFAPEVVWSHVVNLAKQRGVKINHFA